MQLLKHTNSFMGGMNKDLSTSSFKEDTYFDAQNSRVVSGDDTFQSATTTPPTNDTGCVSNIKGTVDSFRLPNNGRVVGSTTLGDNLILLASWKGIVTEVAKITPGVGLITYTATAPDHGLSVGDVACLAGTENFNNRIFIITEVTTDTFSTQYSVPVSGYETESNLTDAYWYIPKFYRITDIIGTGGAFDYQFTSPGHGLTTGDYIFIYGTGDINFDNSATNMIWKQITVDDADHFTITIVGNPADLLGLTTAYAYTLDCSLDKVYRIPFEILDDNYGEVFELQDNYYFLSTEDAVYGAAPLKYDALVYQEDLGLNPRYAVDVISNYETEDVQKIYWCDGFNQLRHLNTVYNYANNNLISLDADLTNMVPSSDHVSITTTLQNGGNLRAGKIQYAYQLYVKHGAETSYSPASKLINLTPTTDNPPNSDDFGGGDLSDIVNKSCVVTIDVGASYIKFNRIRLVALEYEAYATNPTVRVVIEADLTSQTITLYDYGYSIGSLTLEDFRLIQNEISPTTLITKNNYLIAGNIKQKYFDAGAEYESAVLSDTSGATFFPRLDMRAYRWRVLNHADTASGKANTSDISMALVPAYSYIYIDAYGEWRWQVTFALSAETEAAAHVPAWTFTSINLDTIFSNHFDIEVTIDGDRFLLLLKDYNTREICSEITYEEFGGASDYLTIKGNRYGRDSEVRPPSQNYDRNDIVTAGSALVTKQINYSYNYTYVVPGVLPVTDCVLGYGLASHTVVDSNNFEDIPLDHDAINTYNDIANDFTAVNEFKWQEDGLTLGGEGPLISYTFAYDRDIYLGAETTRSPGSHAVLINTAPYTNYLNYLTCRDYVGYMRDEVYRFGIVFYDLQLRPSFVNWIGDIRFPNYYEMPPFDTEGYGHVLYINFTVAWGSFPAGFKDNVSGFRIVRAIRRNSDKTIKCQGAIGMTLLDTNVTPNQNWSYYYLTSGLGYSQAVGGTSAPTNTANCGAVDANWELNEHLLEMFSPEVSFNKEYSYSPTDYLEVVGTSNGLTLDASYNETLDPHYRNVTQTFDCIDRATALGTATTRGTLGGVVDETILSLPELMDPAAHIIDGSTYYARGCSPHNLVGGLKTNKTLSYKGTSLVVGFSTSGITDAATLANTGVMVANLKATLGLSMYGGSTYEQRANTIYVPAGDFSKTAAVMNVYGGDTYLCYFNCLKLFADEDEVDGNGTWQTYITFPVESAINVDWRNDQLQKNITFDSTAADERASYHLNEYETWGIEDYSATYPDDVGNLYTYNSVYSCWDDSKEFLPEPFDFSGVDYYGNRVTSSDHKIANEYTDSWLKFKYVNYKDTESRYGTITKIIKINNNLIFFQPKAIGSLSVEERELIQSQNVGALSLGTGGVLSRYDYITTTSGCSWPKAIITSEGNVYYFDYYNKSLRRLVQEGAEPISELKGLKTYFNNKITTDTNVVLGYDSENRELLCGLKDALYGDNTVVYSLFTDSFLGFQTFNPLQFIGVGNTVFSSPDDTTFWKHNLGERGHFYGTYGDSYITICVNPLKINASTYHVIEWLTDQYSGMAISLIPDGTLTYIDLWDSYQEGKRLCKATSGVITAFADYSGTVAGTVLVTTSVDHGLESGVYVSIAGTTNYNGDVKITVVNTDTFYFTHTWDGDDATGTFEHEGYIQRFRKWRANLLREDSDDSRLRDNHLFVKLVYENDNSNNKIVLHPISTSYLPTKI